MFNKNILKVIFLMASSLTLTFGGKISVKLVENIKKREFQEKIRDYYPQIQNITQEGIDHCFSLMNNQKTQHSQLFNPDAVFSDVFDEYFEHFPEIEKSFKRLIRLVESIDTILNYIAECSQLLISKPKEVPTFKVGFTYMSTAYVEEYTGLKPFEDSYNRTRGNDDNDEKQNVYIGECDDYVEVHEGPPINYANRFQQIKDNVRNQGNCGSCYTFSASGVLEMALLKQNATIWGPLSPQYIIDFDKKDKACSGGAAIQVFPFLQDVGLPLESTYPYVAKPTRRKKVPPVVKAKRICVITGHISEDLRIAYLHKYGPSWFAFKAGDSEFAHYKGGLYNPKDNSVCGSDQNWHAVVLVGYDENSWIIRNSWSTDWGDGGFGRIVRGKNACQSNSQIAFVTGQVL